MNLHLGLIWLAEKDGQKKPPISLLDHNHLFVSRITDIKSKMDLNSLKDQVSNLTLYDLKAGVRKVQNGERAIGT